MLKTVAIFQIWTIAKLRANITNVLENKEATFVPTRKHLYSRDPMMQTTLLFILSTSTRYEYRTKIVSSLTTWLVENWIVIVEVSCFYYYFNQIYLILKNGETFSWVFKILELLHEPEVFDIFYLEVQKSFPVTCDFQFLIWPLKLQIYNAWYASMISSLFEKVSSFDGFNFGKITQN